LHLSEFESLLVSSLPSSTTWPHVDIPILTLLVVSIFLIQGENESPSQCDRPTYYGITVGYSAGSDDALNVEVE
jgi:hypothetical protein